MELVKYICDCGAQYSDTSALLACANSNHGKGWTPRSWPVEVQRLHRIVQAFEEMDETELTAAIHYVNARVDARLRKMREEAAKGETE